MASPARFARLHIEPIGGVAGDMLLAALIDLGADVGAIEQAFAGMAVPGLTLSVERVSLGEIAARHVRSLAPADGEHGRSLAEILALVETAHTSEPARERARAIFRLLAEAEAACHGRRADDVHLHEVGALDSILDVVGIAVALETLGAPRVSSSPVPSGQGHVRAAHGLLELPVPAVRAIVERAGLPLVDVPVRGETVTPTGAAVLATVCERFGPPPAAPATAVGVGAGTRRFTDRPNVVRLHGYAAPA